MKRTNKIALTIAGIAAVGLSLTACGSSDESAAGFPATASASPTAEPSADAVAPEATPEETPSSSPATGDEAKLAEFNKLPAKGEFTLKVGDPFLMVWDENWKIVTNGDYDIYEDEPNPTTELAQQALENSPMHYGSIKRAVKPGKAVLVIQDIDSGDVISELTMTVKKK